MSDDPIQGGPFLLLQNVAFLMPFVSDDDVCDNALSSTLGKWSFIRKPLRRRGTPGEQNLKQQVKGITGEDDHPFSKLFFWGDSGLLFSKRKIYVSLVGKMVKWCKRSLREVSSCPLARELSFYRQKRFFLENWTRLKKVARCPGAGELFSFMKKRQLLKPSPLLSVSSKHYL